MSYQYITTEREGRLFILTINRPDVMNAISPAASHEMAAAIDEFEADDELWVAVITGMHRLAREIGLKPADRGHHRR